MARYGSIQDYQDFIEELLPRGPGGQKPKAPPRAGEALERYLTIRENYERKMHGGRKLRMHEARGILADVIDKFGLDDKRCEAEYLTMDIEPYGAYDEHIGAWVNIQGNDLYENTLIWTEDEGFHIGNFGAEMEAWEEEQRNKDPYPAIRHEGPQGGEDICTPDYVRFYSCHDLYSFDPDKLTPIFTLPFDPENDDHLFPHDYGESADLKDPDERKWWIAFFTALIAAEKKHVRGKGAYWVDRHLDYFWHLRKRERHFGGAAPGVYHRWEPEDFHYCSSDLRKKLESLAKWNARKAMRKARGPNQPTPRPPGLRPVAGDLFTDHWSAMLPHGITFYEVVEVPRRDPNTGLPAQYGRVARQGPAAFTITRREIQQRVGWPRLIHEVRSRAYKARVWAGSPFSDPSTWTLIDVPRQLPDLRGLTLRRRR